MAKENRILILGAAGMIGHRVWLQARAMWGTSVFGVIHKSKSTYGQYGLFDNNVFDKIDVSDWHQLEKILEDVKPDFIINAIGITIRRPEIKDHDYSLEINSFLPHRLQKWAEKNESKVIHLSTDCVFSGESGQYTETSNPTAKDTYGKTKFLGEIDGINALTLRLSCIGQELETRSELLEWFLAQKTKTIKGYTGAIYSGVTTIVIGKEVCRIIKNFPEMSGLYQISSNPISKYDLLLLAKKYFKVDTIIEPFHDFNSNKSLQNQKYVAATNYVSVDWDDMMKELAEDKKIIYQR